MRAVSAVIIAVLWVTGCGGDATKPDYENPSTLARDTQLASDFSQPEAYEQFQGGKGSSFQYTDTNAFSHILTHANDADQLQFRVGNGLFRRIWVAAPASTATADGLGPHFDARGCQACHIKDGRGNALKPGPLDETFVVKLMSNMDPTSEAPHPHFGTQFQRRATVGQQAEGEAEIRFEYHYHTLEDGTKVELRRPVLDLLPHQVDIGSAFTPSIRNANPVIGMGLIEAINSNDILANADPEDRDGDGISGRANWHINPSGEKILGRFGWKAESPTIAHQIAKAFHLDMGLSSITRPTPFGDCTDAQTKCVAGPHGDEDGFDRFEISQTMLELVEAYVSMLAVPARRNVQAAEVLTGKAIFHRLGCAGCHIPNYRTVQKANNALNADQLIWPYTDLLLHDMGQGLSDGPPDAGVFLREWRTPPLWGVGLTMQVNPDAGYLHDGRARNLLEAILWHGGEASHAREKFSALLAEDRQTLITFLESL